MARMTLAEIKQVDPDGPNNPRCRCQHTRKQHSKDGCSWMEQDGSSMFECKCKATYNSFGPMK